MAGFLDQITGLRRKQKIAIQMAVDTVLIIASFAVAMLVRLESLDFAANPMVWVPLIAVIPATVYTLHVTGLYLTLVRYITGRVLVYVTKGVLVSAIVLGVVSQLLNAGVPRSVPFIYAACLLISVGGLRFVIRHFFLKPSRSARQPVIIYGAGEAGVMVANSMKSGAQYGAVAFLDDNPDLHGLTKAGLKVSSPDRVADLVAATGARTLLLALPSLTRRRRREIVQTMQDRTALEIKTIPGMSDLISGRAKISELRNVTPEDLLGRDPVAPIDRLMQRNITGKVVMVSGAGGSIGSELCRQILSLSPERLVLFEISEFALYQIQMELSEEAARIRADVDIVPILGSVQHPRRLEVAIKAWSVQTIYHAAAYKHVPLVEENVIEGIRNNVFGTLEIATAAQRQGVENFILISTDKAVRPTNVMGATKRTAELICQALAAQGGATTFSMVRFGNVLGSSGSVIPRFRSQIEAGGPVTVTHRDVNRFFMTIPEASQLVIQAGAMARGGDVFVLDMGQPVKIIDLAISMVKLHGLQPYVIDAGDASGAEGDIAIAITGLRKGEKLYEELLIGNDPAPTQHPRIMTASERSLPMGRLMPVLEDLRRACERFDLPRIGEILHDLPLDFSPSNAELSDLLWTRAGQPVIEAEPTGGHLRIAREATA